MDNAGKKFLEEDLSLRWMYHKYVQEEEPNVWGRKEDILRWISDMKLPL